MRARDQKGERLYQIVKALDMRPLMLYHVFDLFFTKPCGNIYLGVDESQHERSFDKIGFVNIVMYTDCGHDPFFQMQIAGNPI
ncbi:MAG: hypothetical protein PHT62_11720 [Desulfotomaculaceae bacterium]|nr:hypothetical protein [Desulfotomaculaceae bacterium]